MPPKKKGGKGGDRGKKGGKKETKAKVTRSAMLLALAEKERLIGEQLKEVNLGRN